VKSASKQKTDTKGLKTASVLAFERKLANSDALMFAGHWEDKGNNEAWQAIDIQEKSVRGTISNRLNNPGKEDPAKLDAQIENANIQLVDSAALPFNTDTLKVSFSVRILGNVMNPSVCNEADYQQILKQKIQSYIDQQGFSVLAERYAANLANGRFLWRNRIVFSLLIVKVK